MEEKGGGDEGVSSWLGLLRGDSGQVIGVGPSLGYEVEEINEREGEKEIKGR